MFNPLWGFFFFVLAICRGGMLWVTAYSPPQGSTLCKSTMPAFAGLPPQPHPKHLIRRDTLPLLVYMKSKAVMPMLGVWAAWQQAVQSGPRPTVRRSILHFQAGISSFGDTVACDVSCQIQNRPTVSTDSLRTACLFPQNLTEWMALEKLQQFTSSAIIVALDPKSLWWNLCVMDFDK